MILDNSERSDMVPCWSKQSQGKKDNLLGSVQFSST